MFANAGFGAKRGFLQESPEFWRAMVLTDVLGAALTVRAFVEPLTAARGHLVMMGSVAGRKVPAGSLYGATKWAVNAMGEAARLELHGTGVRVTTVNPAMVDTPFYDDPISAGNLEAADVARVVMFVLSQPPHVDLNEVLMRPTTQEFSTRPACVHPRRAGRVPRCAAPPPSPPPCSRAPPRPPPPSSRRGRR